MVIFGQFFTIFGQDIWFGIPCLYWIICLNIPDYFGSLLDHFACFWPTLGHFWFIIGYFWPFLYNILPCLVMKMGNSIPGLLWTIFPNILDHFEPFCGHFGLFYPFWGSLGHFWVFFVYLGGICVLFRWYLCIWGYLYGTWVVFMYGWFGFAWFGYNIVHLYPLYSNIM